MTDRYPSPVYAIVGNAADGKDFVADLFLDHGFRKVNASDILREMMVENGIVPNRERQTDFANRVRSQHGEAYFAVTAMQRAVQERDTPPPVVMTGLYAPAEAAYVQGIGGKIVRVKSPGDAEQRYQRLVLRADGDRDNISREEFMAAYARENSGASSGEANVAVIEESADYTIFNDGVSVDSIREQIATILSEDAQ